MPSTIKRDAQAPQRQLSLKCKYYQTSVSSTEILQHMLCPQIYVPCIVASVNSISDFSGFQIKFVGGHFTSTTANMRPVKILLEGAAQKLRGDELQSKQPCYHQLPIALCHLCENLYLSQGSKLQKREGCSLSPALYFNYYYQKNFLLTTCVSYW